MQELTHSIADIVIRTEATPPLPRLEFPPFHRFRTHTQHPQVMQRFFMVDGEATGSAGPIHREQRDRLASIPNFRAAWLEEGLLSCHMVLEAIERHLSSPESMQLWTSPGAVSIQDYRNRVLEMYYSDKLGGYEEAFQDYLPDHKVAANFAQFFSTFLPLFECALLHGAGLVRKGKTLLFFAPDDGGKTTLVKNLPDAQVLSDDHIAVRKREGLFYAYGTPFGLLTDGPLFSEVGALFWLKKAPGFHLEPMPANEFLGKLWAENRTLTAFLPKGIKQSAFNLLLGLCRSHPTYQLSVSRDHVDSTALDAALA